MQAKLTDAVEYLAEVGALVSTGGQQTCELAELTRLGRLALDLPLSTCLSRLILIGCSVGMAYEAVIISAYTTLDYDCFIMPTPFTTRSESKFAEVVKSSIRSRLSGDGKQLADTWLVCRMFDTWLKFRQQKTNTSITQCSKEFGEMWGVYPYRLLMLESQVSMVARSLRHLTTGDLRSQMDTLCHLHTVHEVSADIKAPPTLCHDPLRLKALCLLAFPQQVMFGRAEAVCGVPGVESTLLNL